MEIKIKTNSIPKLFWQFLFICCELWFDAYIPCAAFIVVVLFHIFALKAAMTVHTISQYTICGNVVCSIVRMYAWVNSSRLSWHRARRHIYDAHTIKPVQFRFATANIWHHLKISCSSRAKHFSNYLCNEYIGKNIASTRLIHHKIHSKANIHSESVCVCVELNAVFVSCMI